MKVRRHLSVDFLLYLKLFAVHVRFEKSVAVLFGVYALVIFEKGYKCVVGAKSEFKGYLFYILVCIAQKLLCTLDYKHVVYSLYAFAAIFCEQPCRMVRGALKPCRNICRGKRGAGVCPYPFIYFACLSVFFPVFTI